MTSCLHARLARGGATAGETCVDIKLLLCMPIHHRSCLHKGGAERLPSTLHAGHIPGLLALLQTAGLTGSCALVQANHAFRLWGRRNGAEDGVPAPGGAPEEPQPGSKGRAAPHQKHCGNGSHALEGTEDSGEAFTTGHGFHAATVARAH